MNMINDAIHHLSKKTHSERELRDVLETQFISLPDLDKALDETMNYLAQHGLINDARLARNIAWHFAHKGNKFILNTLSQRKIKPEFINEALQSIPDEYTRALEEIQKRLDSPSNHPGSSNEHSNILARFLAGRQFEHATIIKIINQFDTTEMYHNHPLINSSWSLAS